MVFSLSLLHGFNFVVLDCTGMLIVLSLSIFCALEKLFNFHFNCIIIAMTDDENVCTCETVHIYRF